MKNVAYVEEVQPQAQAGSWEVEDTVAPQKQEERATVKIIKEIPQSMKAKEESIEEAPKGIHFIFAQDLQGLMEQGLPAKSSVVKISHQVPEQSYGSGLLAECPPMPEEPGFEERRPWEKKGSWRFRYAWRRYFVQSEAY